MSVRYRTLEPLRVGQAEHPVLGALNYYYYYSRCALTPLGPPFGRYPRFVAVIFD
jgi:hypothetical protein